MNNSHLHPLSAGLLAPFAGAAMQPQPVGTLATGEAAIKRAAYVSALVKMDWSYEFSDDGRVWAAGRDALAALRAMQAEIDPTGELWLRHAPKGHGIPGPFVREGAAS